MGGIAAGCSTDRLDASAIAAAKCSLPVGEKAGFGDDPTEKRDITVTDLGDGRFRVTGFVVGPPEQRRSVGFLCEVEPDPTDQLRGLKVTRIEVDLPPVTTSGAAEGGQES
ncbi:hypothetical protein [Krasilnikovia sp. M28-CT-15]|uniref:hypothetical protein n=1 Tax=Krasilnikovia sp. M28-CT-15 TaxID=3373540 RepID=UPI00399CBC6F